MPRQLLLIFVKQPIRGQVKTRLAATMGDQAALDIYRQLLERTRAITQPLTCDKRVCYTPEIQHNDQWDKSHYQKVRQHAGDLGERMRKAFENGFEQGYQQICIIGSDCYELTTDIIHQAFAALATHDMTIGPSTDGGYYLLGMNRLYSDLFENKPWSTSSVYTDTIRDARQHQRSWQALPKLTDIDREADLHTMKNDDRSSVLSQTNAESNQR